MTGMPFLIRFFRVVAPVPPLMNLAFAATVACAAVARRLDASDAYGMLAPVFLLQTLAASSGFAVPARRGHYDLLLTRGLSRVSIGVMHLAASVAPGVACLLAIAAVEAFTSGGVPRVSLASGTVAGLLVISAVSWALTVPLPRMTGGIVWLLILVAPLDQSLVPPWVTPWLLPSTLVGVDVVSLGWGTLLPLAIVVTISIASGLLWICHTDVSLQVAR
jgi:hypothetical protein